MTSRASAGRGPSGKKSAPSRTQRSRAASPSRRAARDDEELVERQTAYTARAAILLVALVSVIVAVAVPLKIWVGQRNGLTSLATQTRQTQLKLAQLKAENRQWHQPAYIEAQARTRLHYVLPGQKTYIVLGRTGHATKTAAAKRAIATNGPWYSQFWQSDRSAGK
jgi:cell division protein FtsB